MRELGLKILTWHDCLNFKGIILGIAWNWSTGFTYLFSLHYAHFWDLWKVHVDCNKHFPKLMSYFPKLWNRLLHYQHCLAGDNAFFFDSIPQITSVISSVEFCHKEAREVRTCKNLPFCSAAVAICGEMLCLAW